MVHGEASFSGLHVLLGLLLAILSVSVQVPESPVVVVLVTASVGAIAIDVISVEQVIVYATAPSLLTLPVSAFPLSTPTTHTAEELDMSGAQATAGAPPGRGHHLLRS